MGVAERLSTTMKEGRQRDQALRREGWSRCFTAEEPRLSEWVALYGAMGLEVRQESFIPDPREECQLCYLLEPQRYRTLYTRPRPDGAAGIDELF